MAIGILWPTSTSDLGHPFHSAACETESGISTATFITHFECRRQLHCFNITIRLHTYLVPKPQVQSLSPGNRPNIHVVISHVGITVYQQARLETTPEFILGTEYLQGHWDFALHQTMPNKIKATDCKHSDNVII